MIHLRNLLSLICCSLFLSASAQTYNYNWDKTYGGNSRDWNCSVVKGGTNTLFLIGDSETNINGDKTVALCNPVNSGSDVWLIKADTSGAIIWQRDFGGESDERNPQLVLLNNPAKEMIFACYSTSDIACDKSEANRDTIPLISADYWIAKLDSNGVILWEKTLGGDNYDDFTKIAVLSTGEIVVCGESNSPVGYDKTQPNYSISNDLWAVKLDMNGNILGDYIYGGTGGEFLSTIIPDSQGGYILAGSTNSDISGDVSQAGQGNLDYWMIQIDAQGNKVWDKRFGGQGPDQCNHAIRTTDNGYLLCGFTVSPQGGDVSQAPKGLQDYWVVKTDALGNKQWDKRFGGTLGSFGTFAANSHAGRFWVAGYTSSANVTDVSEPTYGGSDYWLLQIDNLGNKLFDKRFGGSNNEFGTSLVSLTDTTFLAFGYSDSGASIVKNAPSKGWLDYWMVKFTYNDGTVGLAEDMVHQTSSINLYPNPAGDILNVHLYAFPGNQVSLYFHDVTGKMVFHKAVNSEFTGNNFEVNCSHLEAGIYIVTAENNAGNRIYSRLVKL